MMHVFSRTGTVIRFSRAFAERGLLAAPVRYRSTLDDTESQSSDSRQAGWKTIGGGASVFIDDAGKITAGCPGLVEEDVDDLVDESDASRARRDHRQDVAEAKGLEGDDLGPGDAKKLEEHPHPETGRDADGEPKPPAKAPRWAQSEAEAYRPPVSPEVAALRDRLQAKLSPPAPPKLSPPAPPAELPESFPTLAKPLPAGQPGQDDTIGDRNSAAEPHLVRVPDKSLGAAMRSLHGLRDNRRHGHVATEEMSPELASRLHATIAAAIAKPDGFGEAYDLKKQGLGYASPAGSMIVRPPAKKGGAWHVSYTAQTEIVGGKSKKEESTADSADVADKGTQSDPSATSAPSAVKSPAQRRKPKAAADDTFDPAAFEPSAPAKAGLGQPAPAGSLNPDTPFGQAVRRAADDYDLPVEELADAVNFVWQERRQFVESQESAMRDLIGHFYPNRGKFTRALQRANDADDIPHFDELLEAARNSGYAELFGGNRGGRTGLEARLFDFLKQGKRRLPARHDPEIVREAVDLARRAVASSAAMAGSAGSGYADEFARAGQVVRYRRWRVERAERVKRYGYDPSEPRDELRRWVSPGGQADSPKNPSSTAGFFSSNIATHTDLSDAVKMLRSERHHRFLALSREIDDNLQLDHHTFSVLGDWSSDPEASIVTEYSTGGADYQKVRLAMAIKGKLANQKAVLAFREQGGGPDSFWTISLEDDLASARAQLTRFGIRDRSLEVNRTKVVRVHLVDFSHQLGKALGRLTRHYGNRIQIRRFAGHGELIGSTDEHSGRVRGLADYNQIIAATGIRLPLRGLHGQRYGRSTGVGIAFAR